MRTLLIVVALSLLLASSAAAAQAPGYSLGGSAQTLADWRTEVGHGALTGDRRHRLSLVAEAAVRATRATIVRESVIGGSRGPAVYLDLAAGNPVWTLRHASSLVRLLSRRPFSGGWAIRLRDAFHKTVWIAGSAGNTGFVGSADTAIDNASPVKHSEPVTFP
jgi:hypothetical protein